jgi:hypothetical protein
VIDIRYPNLIDDRFHAIVEDKHLTGGFVRWREAGFLRPECIMDRCILCCTVVGDYGGICGIRVNTPPVRGRPGEGHDEETPRDGDLTEEDTAVKEELELPKTARLLQHILQVFTDCLHGGLDLLIELPEIGSTPVNHHKS